MSSPSVSCTSCERSWFSPTMAEGLRLVGKCPRCGGELAFAADAPPPDAAPHTAAGEPHHVLGLPRR